MLDLEIYKGKRVLITGHTGFKGAWLSEWLLMLGAEVWGYSLPPPTKPSLFNQLCLKSRLHHKIGDISNAERLSAYITRIKPDFVFHLAAQPIVRFSYENPVLTYQTNVMGTINILEAMRQIKHPCAAVLITTDKCYENKEQRAGYKEGDPLGGYDPYSSSKGAAEIAIASWRRSFFDAGQSNSSKNSHVGIASVRAGNVIGGGDWANDRIVPDMIRSLSKDKPIIVRNPKSTRPWQHVLEPLGGYLVLGSKIYSALNSKGINKTNELKTYCAAFNFGPLHSSTQTVKNLVEVALGHWRGSWEDHSNQHSVHEAMHLSLSIVNARKTLNWTPVWSFKETIKYTLQWYIFNAEQNKNKNMLEFTRKQIDIYQHLLGQ